MQNKRLIGILFAASFLLLIPLVVMLFTGEVKWGVFDFAAAGILLFGTGLACELVLRLVKNTGYRIAICAAVLAALVVVWLELAVGIIGTPLAGS